SHEGDRFCITGGHEQWARRRCAERLRLLCPKRTHTRNQNFYHTRSLRAILRPQKPLPRKRDSAKPHAGSRLELSRPCALQRKRARCSFKRAANVEAKIKPGGHRSLRQALRFQPNPLKPRAARFC